MSHKGAPKMCKSPKAQGYASKVEKIDYEHLSTNCTVVGSNNLNLVKKPQIVTSMSPVYSNPSPGYPQSPYSSPASMKSPSPNLKPPTPQPSFPVMQIIHNTNLIGRPMQAAQPQNIIKLKPHLNILPKPAASPQQSPKPSVSPQIVIPTTPPQQTLVPAQPLLLNQVPMLAAPGVQFVLRPPSAPTPKMPTAPPGLVLQANPQPLIQLQQGAQPVAVRVLANGVQLGGGAYVAQMANSQMQQVQQVNAVQGVGMAQKKKPKHKQVKKKLDLANIMKLSGIGDEDDIQFESDTSQSESEHNSLPTTPQATQNFEPKKNIQNIQISAIPQPTINATPVVQVLNQNFQSGMISNSTSQAQSIPFNSFITPNFTINNGLMLQRSGGFKLAVGDDGRLVLQHDPAINQDIQNQLILQSLLGLNGGLVLQPSLDQQTVQQTVQTIQQQSVQTIQQQTVQSQTIQTVQQQTVQPQVQHIQSIQPQIQQQTVQQTIQHQTVNALQQPMQIVQPQPIHSIAQPINSISQSRVHSLQSLLAQQNAVQTQTVHSHIQPHVQTVQNVQNTVQNVQNALQNTVQSVQNVPQSVQNVQSIAQSVQTVQNVPQSVQNVPQNVQTVHPQPISSPVHTFQQAHTQTNQPVLKVQPFQKSAPPVQTVQPIQQQNNQHENQQSSGSPTSYVVNLTPEQLEQLKRNGQLTVNGQTIYMQRPNKADDKKVSPKLKPVKKIQKIQNIKSVLQENVSDSIKTINNTEQIKTVVKSKQILPQNHVQPIQNKTVQPQQAMVQPQTKLERQKSPVSISPTKQQKVSPIVTQQQTSEVNGTIVNNSSANNEVDKLLGQILEETNSNNASNVVSDKPQQKITTIQLTPQKQQHLKNIQQQIHTLSTAARIQPQDQEIQSALKLLFAEQQKILASGKVLPLDKVYYHNNQLIVNSGGLNLPSPSNVSVKSENNCGNGRSNEQVQVQQQQRVVPATSVQPITTQSHTTPRISVSVSTSTGDHGTQTTIHHHPTHQQLQQHQQNSHNAHIAHQNHVISSRPPVPQQPTVVQSPPNVTIQKQPVVVPTQQQTTSVVVSQQDHQQKLQLHQQSLAKKSHLIDTQLNLDQKGAVKPDVHTPFRDKKDACIRLIRYHCMDQPVLSQKDLNKADEIFELTAKHFIGKYGKMVDKYKYLLMKESMRQVQTSELMMLDRMFLADEQQLLVKQKRDYENDLLNASTAHDNQPSSSQTNTNCESQEEYDEWACIQRELACIPEKEAQPNLKRASASTDSRLETLKRFRVEKHSRKEIVGEETENNSIDEQVQSAIDSILNLQQNTNLDLDSILS